MVAPMLQDLTRRASLDKGAVSDTAVLVTTAAELEQKAEAWMRRCALGVDTEFFRERTFYPILGLIQVSDGRENVLVDPLAVTDLEPLRRVLMAPGVVKIFHSCAEDLEVFFHRFGTFPRPIFDTQIAAAFAGQGFSAGFARLVEELFGVCLPKGQTRSNWLRRPLSEAQKTYAALDVAYLMPLYQRLQTDLQRSGRERWAREEVEQLADERRFLPDPDTLYVSLGKSRSRSRHELAVLRAVCAWREREARRRDLPRNFVLSRAALIDLARHRPRDRHQLSAIDALRPSDLRRHGRTLLGLVRDALELPAEKLPPLLERPLDVSPYRRQVTGLRRAISRRADELGIPAELLANRKTAENLVRRAVRGATPILPKSLSAWRAEILGELVTKTLGAIEKPEESSL